MVLDKWSHAAFCSSFGWGLSPRTCSLPLFSMLHFDSLILTVNNNKTGRTEAALDYQLTFVSEMEEYSKTADNKMCFMLIINICVCLSVCLTISSLSFYWNTRIPTSRCFVWLGRHRWLSAMPYSLRKGFHSALLVSHGGWRSSSGHSFTPVVHHGDIVLPCFGSLLCRLPKVEIKIKYEPVWNELQQREKAIIPTMCF